MGSNKLIIGSNDLQSQYPDVAKESYGWEPVTITAKSNQKKYWKCNNDHIYQSTVANRTSRGDGCPFCSGHQVLAGFNDLKTKFPNIAAEAYEWDPSMVMPGSGKKQDWKCNKGHIYSSVVNDRTSIGNGCPFCSGHQVLAGFNDLKTKFPNIAAEAYGWDPTTVTAGANQKKEWKCKEGHIYSSTVNGRTGGGKGCAVCSGKQVLAGFNDLKTKFPNIAAEAYGWDPTTIVIGTHSKQQWKGKCGHIWTAVVKSRTLLESGCPICAGQQVLAGFNDLKTKFPDIAAEAYGWNPETVTAVSGKRHQWKGKCGHIWSVSVSHRINGTGCPICAEYGFNPSKDAFFYLMQRPGEQQLGITNELDVRMKTHERNGWILLDHTVPALGQKVLDTENAFKKWLKKEIGLMDGTTENWSTTKMEVHSLAELKARSGIETDLF